ncbi:universal stress protein [Streptomyces sp. CB01881]|uniref:universal stress protein n=1 Tax=Streptomyces sp. CB01881 TaxID=2078691 RepID=UPI000CDBAF53|nr:universal stress protein [Streptomyces sp. CB01881]AUY53573.1 universal stress protein [Streptomyces sp. CB01881]TYC69717.1 universal stress protein [Streptomyces sp. CB01881]
MNGSHRNDERPRGRVVVGVSGSLGSLAALHRAVAEARRTGAEVIPVLAWEPPGGELGYRRSPCPPLLAAVRDTAEQRLRDALDAAFAGADPGVPMHPLVVRGETGPALVQTADRPGDLLVVGRSGGPLRRRLRRSVTDYCTRKAGCSVLAVARPELQQDLETLHRRIHWHLPVGPAPELVRAKG